MGLFDIQCAVCKKEKCGKSVKSKVTGRVYLDVASYQKEGNKLLGFMQICDSCYAKEAAIVSTRHSQRILVTTTGSLEGYRITEYVGVIGSQTVLGGNVIKDFVASITDFTGGQSGTTEQILSDARNLATQKIIDEAIKVSANAIVGLKLDFETIGQAYMCIATGTAVKVGKLKVQSPAPKSVTQKAPA